MIYIECDECGESVPANHKDITRHAAECWGAAAHVYGSDLGNRNR